MNTIKMPALEVDVGDEIVAPNGVWRVDFAFCDGHNIVFYCADSYFTSFTDAVLDVRLGNGRAHLNPPITEVRRVD